MSLADAFAPAEAANRALVMRQTWGHLDTQPGEVHPGHILFALGCHGDIVLLEWEFEGVEPNPWIFSELNEFIGEKVMKTDRQWGVWLFEGTYRVFKNGKSNFAGDVRPCRVTTRFGKKKRSF